MIVKFLSTQNGGGSGSIDYALNQKRIENGTARVLKGDERMTRDLIATITKKQKTTFAVLSFEEANIPEEQKRELMREFESTFFAGLRPDQYNTLWIEHTDKGRLELNMIAPKFELSTGKSFNPYNHKTDFHLADLFQKWANLKYGYSDPKDPAKTATVSGSKKQIGLFKDYKELDQKLKHLVAEGAIQDRTELIDLLKENGIEVTRASTDYISVKLPESKKARRLNGGIYNEQFTSIDELRDIREKSTQREGAFASRNCETEYREVSQRLGDAVAKRAQYNEPIYREPKKRERELEIRVAERAREPKIVQRRDVQSSQQRPIETQEARKPIPMGLDHGEVENDRIRSAVARYARAREERSRTRTRRSSERTQRTILYASINRTAATTDYRAIEQAYRGRQLRSYIAESVKQLPRILDRVTRSIVERVKELTKPIDRELEQIRAMFGKTDTKGKGLKEAVQGLFDREKEQQPTRSAGLFRR
jgi:hypothetical protein